MNIINEYNKKGKIMIRDILISILIGIAAGTIDIIPMIKQKLSKAACVSAFLQYLFVSIVIINIHLPFLWFIKGSVVSFALALPIAVLISENDRKASSIILLNSVILGLLISVAGHFLIR